MKKFLGYIVALISIIAILTACSISIDDKENVVTTKTESSEKTGENKIKVVSTIFPSYDWIREIVGDEKDSYDLKLLLDKGSDLHNYQPSAEDIAKISTCDLFIYVGGESDAWVEDVLKNSTNKNMKVINLVESLGDGAKLEEIVEGMEVEEHEHSEEEHEHSEEEHMHEEIAEVDEHVWLSLKNASIYVLNIKEALKDIDKDKASIYEKNANAYIEKLKNLDAKYQEVVDNASNKTLLFGDRFPFRYLVDDYGISYYAAFVGCSAETEASFDTVIFLANKLDELNLKNILTIENSDKKLAKTIIENTKEKDEDIESLNSMQAISKKDIEDGVSYLKIMQDNLEVLKKVLN